MQRPQLLEDVVGQEEVKKRLEISIKSAIQRNAPLDHVLFSGPPGTGKTTLACVIANELSVDVQIANGANIRSTKQILPYVFNISPRSVLFIDEIHRLPRVVEEFIYPLMEDFRLDFTTTEETTSMEVDPFTLIGATTLAGTLSPPFHDRFGIHEQLNLYTREEIAELLMVKSRELQLVLEFDEAINIAKRSRGTPRVAQGLLRWVRDISLAEQTTPSESLVNEAMRLKGIDERGLTNTDRRYTMVLQDQFGGGPAGIDTLSDALRMSKETVENVVEPYLIYLGLIRKTSKGRILV